MLTVIKFGAEWCAPCKTFEPVFKAVSSIYSNIEFLTVDIDEDSDTASLYGVRSIPTVVIKKDDKVVDTIVGLVNKNELSSRINQHL